MQLDGLLEMSNRYGKNEDYVLAGGGNTSYKEDGKMYVKGSGTSLADITARQFVGMDVEKLRSIVGFDYPDEMSEERMEENVLGNMMEARLEGNDGKRPSVESILHALFVQKYVLHIHPALVNGMTCGKDGERICDELFGDEAIWIGLVKPGITLAKICEKAFNDYYESKGKFPHLIFLKNHGVFVAADSVEGIDAIFGDMWKKLEEHVKEVPNFDSIEFDRKKACQIAPALRMLYSGDGKSVALFCTNTQVQKLVSNAKEYSKVVKPFSPDHMVYCEGETLFIGADRDILASFADFEKKKGYKPKIVAIQGLGFFALGKNKKVANQARQLFLDAVKVATYAESFGGTQPMTDEFIDFISNWEVEKYRSRISSGSFGEGRLEGRIALITGGAQGIGKGIAECVATQGAYVVVADLNYDGAASFASELNLAHSPFTAIAVEADVTNADSVENMIEEVVLNFGGLDILVSNAGVLVAGSLSDLSEESFDFVTDVNYKGFYLCAKYASKPMIIQHKFSPSYMSDIIEINSKSGLEGSNRNFAYAGSKFGGIGLTQSFALELIEFGIKVNAICPGNFLDGPLWADPENGLFKQYLDSGKVSGAKTIQDVRKFYEDKVPMKRGCTYEDVARAIYYIVEQKYETGQAVPVTGGQIMLS